MSDAEFRVWAGDFIEKIFNIIITQIARVPTMYFWNYFQSFLLILSRKDDISWGENTNRRLNPDLTYLF